MKLLVSGSRSIEDAMFVFDTIRNCRWSPDVLIHGGADGVDSHADSWARSSSVDVECHPIPDWAWERFGPVCGPERNSYMLGRADAVLVIWDGASDGTRDVITKASERGIPMQKVVVDLDDGMVEHVVVDEMVESDQASLLDYEGD